MEVIDYQLKAKRTLIDGPERIYTDTEMMLIWNAMGLAGEAGEVANSIKKMVFHEHGIDYGILANEIGDVLWYVAALCTKLGLRMDEVMESNISKLEKRYPAGFDPNDSINREEK